MPPSGESSSNEPEGPLENDSVYDFLYQDVRRVGSYLAQLNPGGYVSSIKQTLGTEETGSHDATISAGANAAVVKGGTGYTTHAGNTNKDTLERSIDPFWSNAVDLLNLLYSRGMIQQDIDKAGLGSFLVVSGEILIVDTLHSRPAMSIPEIKAHYIRNMVSLILKDNKFVTLVGDSDPAQLSSKDREKRAQRDARLSIALIATLPDTVQLRLRTDIEQIVYCPIQSSGLIATASDLTMNHGALIQGIWHILGIYDAKPDDADDEIEALTQKFKLNESQPLTSAAGYAALLRGIGRSNGLYGITPLLVFRHIGVSP